VQRSVKASPQRIIQEGVLREVFLHIAAITRLFPTTASGDKKAMTIEVDRATALKAELRFLATPSIEQGLKDKSEEGKVKLLLMADFVFALEVFPSCLNNCGPRKTRINYKLQRFFGAYQYTSK